MVAVLVVVKATTRDLSSQNVLTERVCLVGGGGGVFS